MTGDELAAGVLNGLSDHGVSVPEEFEIITTDDSQIARYTRPNLTTVAQPLYDWGTISMRMLTKIMHKEELEEARSSPTSWFDRTPFYTKTQIKKSGNS